ncbi:MAG: hypothetical protein Kow00124_14890 [Anaerolineae bacterium]
MQGTVTPLIGEDQAPPPGLTPSATETPAPHYAPIFADVVTDVELHYYERWMRVEQTTTVQNTSADTWQEVVFNAIPNAVPGSFFLDLVTVGSSGETPAAVEPSFTDETMLHVPLPRPARPGEEVVARFSYRVLIPPVAPTDWPPVGTTGWTLDLIQAGEWYPALVPYAEGIGWHTWRYHPVGDPTFYPLSNHTLNVTTEEGVTVVSGGAVGRDGQTWRFNVERARGVAFFASDRFEVTEGEVDGIPVSSYYLSEHAHAGINAYGIAVNALKLFTELYGPYPYDSLTVVENGFFGGMEYSALISVTSYAYYTYTGEARSLLALLIAHEIAHQWWYGAVGNDQVNEAWLDESLAFYSELLYMERYAPQDTGWWWYARVDQFDPQGPVDASPYDYANAPSFILWMYGQAARFIRDLRLLMGDEAFFAFLRDYYQTYQWQTVTREDFMQMAQRYAASDITPLVERYFDGGREAITATPPLEIDDRDGSP